MKVLTSANLPKAVGPYSLGVRSHGFTFTSGQIGLDENGNPLPTTLDQLKQVMKNLSNILDADGLTFDNVVKTEIFLTDLSEFKAVNEAYSKYFTPPFPVRSTVQVAALPAGVSIEIAMMAEGPRDFNMQKGHGHHCTCEKE